MKILIAPDKFKGSLSAQEVCDAVEHGILNILPITEVIKLPLADGGEGSLEVLEPTLKFERKYLMVNNPLFSPIKTWYGLKNDIAFVEMAKASGLQLLKQEERNPKLTSSFGTGELIIDAINNGAKKIFLFIGGSATNDAGMGIANALGYKFFDKNRKELLPTGGNLIEVADIKLENKCNFDDVKFIVLTDVQNIFYGKNGAAYNYAKQKGADNSSIKLLNLGLKNLSELFIKLFNKDIANIPGSGAAGGIGGGMIAFFNAKLMNGARTILEMLEFENFVSDSDFIITGEGKFDYQTMEGKLVKAVLDICRKHHKPVSVVCGISTVSAMEIKKLGLVSVNSIVNDNISTNDAMRNAKHYLVKRAEELIKNTFM